MKKSFYLAATAALLMFTTSAHAGSGISFEIGGQRIHIDAPRNCNSLDCLSVSNNGSRINLKHMNLKGKNSDDDDVASNPPPAPSVQAPAPAPVADNPPPAPAAPSAPVANNAPPATPAPVTDASHERLSGLGATNDQPLRAANAAPAASAPVASTAQPVQQAAPAAPPPAQQPAVAPPAANTPLGLWQTADNKGNVRIEQCGANLCGYAEHTNERILINMKPASDNKWTGRIHDPDSGSNYDSTIALKGPSLLKVQGCAFGGMFCGGQTWKRIS
jgi:uncharacterized protein (DUF2147 family)